jgi:hypothetical protein
LSFASSNLIKTLIRIKNEANDMLIFKTINCCTENNLNYDFLNSHYNFIMNNKRGYGYWIWKSQIIKQHIDLLNDGEILLYCDSGCQLNNTKLAYINLNKYIKRAKSAETTILSFNTNCSSEEFTKEDLFITMNCNNKSVDQISATVLLIIINNGTRNLINGWVYYTTSNYHNIDDSPSINPNYVNFNDHRHDQSVFSILGYKYNIYINKNEIDTFTNGWEEGKQYPINAKRLKY